MGNRVKGRPKRKSIKAALHSRVSSKRKLSRMGKKQKKHHAGLEATFIGRAKCLKMLQITIKDFRRLCILKGIYPREPRGRAPGNKKGQTFYHIKDIKSIAHEPILEKFREFRSFLKKIRRSAGRNEKDEAARKNAYTPTYTLHHLVRERYPRFIDALSDMDDALTLTYLFAALPSEGSIKSKAVNKAKSLAAAWGAYCATTACITKSFISVKGVYMEATVRGAPIRWIVPHSFTQYLPNDVDYRVMLTFFEFYETLLNFVLFKLYNDIGVRYPLPLVEVGSEVKGSNGFILGSNLRSLSNAMATSSGKISEVVSKSLNNNNRKKDETEEMERKAKGRKEKELMKTVGTALKNLDEESDGSDGEGEEEEVDVAGPLKAALESMAEEQDRAAVPGGETDLDDNAMKRKRLFAGLTFFLSREIPRGYLELVCLAYGGKVGWEGDNSPIAMNDASITHHIVDRPKLLQSYDSLPKSREFVQPQWILDSANFMFLLPITKYAVGTTLPPHLSPWVDNEEEGYTPAYAEEIQRLKNGEPLSAIDESNSGKNESGDDNDHDRDADAVSAADSDTPMEQEQNEEEEDDDNDDDEPEENEDDEKDQHADKKQKKLEKKKNQKEDQLQKRKAKAEKEAHELAKTMMSKKAAHLYGRMQHGIAQRKAKADKLHERRKEIEKAKREEDDEENPLTKRKEIGRSKKKDEDGKTPLKQKVERLKEERKRVEDEYSSTSGTMKKSKKRRKG